MAKTPDNAWLKNPQKILSAAGAYGDERTVITTLQGIAAEGGIYSSAAHSLLEQWSSNGTSSDANGDLSATKKG